MQIQTIDIRSITDPGEGTLSFFEAERDLPFAIKRIYFIHGVPKGILRGGHAHKNLRQMLWCPRGDILMRLDDGTEKREVPLNDPTKGLVLGSDIWREMLWREADSVLCVAADAWYSEEDYIRDYDEFLRYIGKKK